MIKVIFRQFRRDISLRVVNIVGLGVMFACILLSWSYIKNELSYDEQHSKGDRIVRLSVGFGEEAVDGRVFGPVLKIKDALRQYPEVEEIVELRHLRISAAVKYKDHKLMSDALCAVSRNFFDVFDVGFVAGLNSVDESQCLISESIAKRITSDSNLEALLNTSIHINGADYFISGIFEDFPQNSHFSPQVMVLRPEGAYNPAYVYLLLKDASMADKVATEINDFLKNDEQMSSMKAYVELMPLRDIHLYSHNLIEMGENGDIKYIYLIVGANLLLLLVVLFNLWLNSTLTFSSSLKFYQIKRLLGSSAFEVIKSESMLTMMVAGVSIAVGIILSYYAVSAGYISAALGAAEVILISVGFLAVTALVSLIPSLSGLARTQFLDTSETFTPGRFSYKNIRWALTLQYSVVIMVVILSFCITKQLNLIKDTQVGAKEDNILVVNGLSEECISKLSIFKEKLLSHPEIVDATNCFQVPGDPIRDKVNILKSGMDESVTLPLLIGADNFLEFYDVDLVAGTYFKPMKLDFATENQYIVDYLNFKTKQDRQEEYIINGKALALLGFKSAQEAIGAELVLDHDIVSYYKSGKIVGVVEDFNYTGGFEKTAPMIILSRNYFQFNLMLRLQEDNIALAQSIFTQTWEEIFPDYPVDYTMMGDIFNNTYRNELKAQKLVSLFALLCFILADLGLIIFMAFIIKSRTREISIRKVHGATVSSVLIMLNADFMRYVLVGFAVAVPVAWVIMQKWLENFAYRTSLSWWVFAGAGLCVLLLSLASVSVQSYRAAVLDPVRGIKEN